MQKNTRKGFTIVEMVVVVAVIAILATVLIPSFSGVVEKARHVEQILADRMENLPLDEEKPQSVEDLTRGADVTLTNDVVIDGVVEIPVNVKATWHLNGKRLILEEHAAIMIKGELTIVGDGTVLVKARHKEIDDELGTVVCEGGLLTAQEVDFVANNTFAICLSNQYGAQTLLTACTFSYSEDCPPYKYTFLMDPPQPLLHNAGKMTVVNSTIRNDKHNGKGNDSAVVNSKEHLTLKDVAISSSGSCIYTHVYGTTEVIGGTRHSDTDVIYDNTYKDSGTVIEDGKTVIEASPLVP